jgi:hypothetical protein
MYSRGIKIVIHPMDSGVLTINRNGLLVPCVNGRTIVELNHNVFRLMVHETSGHKRYLGGR